MTSIEYRVRSGDTLRAIARRYRVTEQMLGQLNGLSDLNHIRAGQVLRIPKPPPTVASTQARPPKVHQVLAKDTLESIAQQYNVPQDLLMQANSLRDAKDLRIGQRLTIPPGDSASPKHEKDPSKSNVVRTAALAVGAVSASSSKAGADGPKTPQELKARFPELARRSDKELQELLDALEKLKSASCGLDGKLFALVKLLRVVQKADLKRFLQQVGVKHEMILKIAGATDLTEALEKALDSSKGVADRIAAGITVAKELYAFVPEKDVPPAVQNVFKGLSSAAQLVSMVGTLRDPKAGGLAKLKAVLEFGVALKKDLSDAHPELGKKLRALNSSLAIPLDFITLLNLDGDASKVDRIKAASRLIANAVDARHDFQKVRALVQEWLTKLGVPEAASLAKEATPKLAGTLAETAGKEFQNVSPEIEKTVNEAFSGMEKAVEKAVRGASLDDGRPMTQAMADLMARIPAESREAVAKLVKDFDEHALKLFLQSSESMDGATLGKFVDALAKHLDSKVMSKLLIGINAVITKLGLKLGKELGKKILKGLGKLVPVAGAVPAIADTWTNAQLAQDTKLPPILRCLGSLNASLNAVDAVLGIIEVLGVTNVDVVVQVPLGLFELALDLIITAQKAQFDANPKGYKAPAWLEGLVGLLAVLMGPSGVSQLVAILGVEGTERLMIKCSHGGGKLAIRAAEYSLIKMADGTERGLKNIAGLIDALADVLRNPEKYWAKAEAQIRNVVDGVVKLWNKAGALADRLWEGLKKLVDDLKALGTRGLEALKWIAHNPGKIAELAVEAITDLAQRAGDAIAKAALATLAALQAFYKDAAGRIKKGFETALKLAKQTFDKLVDGFVQLVEKGGALAAEALSALKELVSDLRAMGEAGLEKLQWIAQHPGEAAALALNAIQEMMKKAGQALLQAGLVALSKLRDFYLEAKNRIKKGIDTVLAAVTKAFDATVRFALNLGKKGLDALVWLAKNPDVALARAADWVKNKLVDLASAVADYSKRALDTLLAAGERAAAYMGRAVDALKQACMTALDKGKKALDLIIWVAENPGTVVKAVAKSVVNAVKFVAEGVSQLAKNATDALLRFIDGQKQVYEEARAAVSDLIKQMGAAADRVLEAWKTRLTSGANAILASLKNLKDAGVQLFTRIVAKGGQLIQAGLQQLNSMMQAGIQSALDAMTSLARKGGEAARQVLDLLANSVPVRFVRSVLELFADLGDKLRMSTFVKKADQAYKIVSQTYAEGGLSAVVKLIARTGYSVGSELVSVLWHRVVKTSMDIVDFARAFLSCFSVAEMEKILGIDIPFVGN